jgi:hypothetical protein
MHQEEPRRHLPTLLPASRELLTQPGKTKHRLLMLAPAVDFVQNPPPGAAITMYCMKILPLTCLQPLHLPHAT